MITAVLFDIDGTLVDSVDLHAARAASRFTGTRRICWRAITNRRSHTRPRRVLHSGSSGARLLLNYSFTCSLGVNVQAANRRVTLAHNLLATGGELSSAGVTQLLRLWVRDRLTMSTTASRCPLCSRRFLIRSPKSRAMGHTTRARVMKPCSSMTRPQSSCRGVWPDRASLRILPAGVPRAIVSSSRLKHRDAQRGKG